MKVVAIWLDLMSTNDAQIIVFLEHTLYGLITVFNGAFSFLVVLPLMLSRVLIFAGIRPQNIAQKSFKWRLHKSVNFIYVTRLV